MNNENKMNIRELDPRELKKVVAGHNPLQAPEGIGPGDWNYFWWMVGEGKARGMTLEEEIRVFSGLPLFSGCNPEQVKAWIREIYEQA